MRIDRKAASTSLSTSLLNRPHVHRRRRRPSSIHPHGAFAPRASYQRRHRAPLCAAALWTRGEAGGCEWLMCRSPVALGCCHVAVTDIKRFSPPPPPHHLSTTVSGFMWWVWRQIQNHSPVCMCFLSPPTSTAESARMQLRHAAHTWAPVIRLPQTPPPPSPCSPHAWPRRMHYACAPLAAAHQITSHPNYAPLTPAAAQRHVLYISFFFPSCRFCHIFFFVCLSPPPSLPFLFFFFFFFGACHRLFLSGIKDLKIKDILHFLMQSV